MPRSIHHVNAFQETCIAVRSMLGEVHETPFLTLPKADFAIDLGIGCPALRHGPGDCVRLLATCDH